MAYIASPSEIAALSYTPVFSNAPAIESAPRTYPAADDILTSAFRYYRTSDSAGGTVVPTTGQIWPRGSRA